MGSLNCKYLQKLSFLSNLDFCDIMSNGNITPSTHTSPISSIPFPSQCLQKIVFLPIFTAGLNQRDACANLKMIWQRDLGCEWTDEEWAKIIAESGRYIREARGKCIQYKIIHRFYYTPSRLHRIGVMDNNLCWKCKSVTGTLIHALWECGSIKPFWRKVLECLETW